MNFGKISILKNSAFTKMSESFKKINNNKNEN